MKIDDQKLEALFELKKAQKADDFPLTQSDFYAALKEAQNHRSTPFYRYMAYAASILIVVTTVFFVINSNVKKSNGDILFAEAQKLFDGDEVAIIELGGEIFIGERLNPELPAQEILLRLPDNTIVKLSAAENDTIMLDNGISGEIILSRTDKTTLIAELNLRYGDKIINDIVKIGNPI